MLNPTLETYKDTLDMMRFHEIDATAVNPDFEEDADCLWDIFMPKGSSREIAVPRLYVKAFYPLRMINADIQVQDDWYHTHTNRCKRPVRTVPCCRTCGAWGSDLRQNCDAYWDFIQEELVIADAFDNHTCEQCDGECSTARRVLDPAYYNSEVFTHRCDELLMTTFGVSSDDVGPLNTYFTDTSPEEVVTLMEEKHGLQRLPTT